MIKINNLNGYNVWAYSYTKEWGNIPPLQYAGLAEQADAHDSKSCRGNSMRVRFPHPAPVLR